MIYLDDAATGYVNDDNTTWMNPNTKYAHVANKTLQDAESRIMDLLGVSSGMIVFGGQNASQLIDLLYWKCKNKGIYFCSSKYEHDCIYNKVQGYGYFSDYNQAIDCVNNIYNSGDSNIFCQMLTNNLTGEIFDNKPLGQYCSEHNQFFMVDCTAAISHVQLPNDLEQWCDCIVMSGHKFGGGYMGCMWLSDRLCEELDIHSASNLASGTPNVKGIDDFVRAFELANKDIDNKELHCNDMLEELETGLRRYAIEYKHIFPTTGYDYTSHINAIRLPGINADALQQYLASKQIYIGLGHSACDSNSDDFRVLQAYGLSKQEASEVVRISFNQWNNVEEIDELVKQIKNFKELFV